MLLFKNIFFCLYVYPFLSTQLVAGFHLCIDFAALRRYICIFQGLRNIHPLIFARLPRASYQIANFCNLAK